ncbi:hypothetical protein [Brevundimonas sp. FT23042]|uniref:hypothetical protein n=1 Tax=Brevundimonas sp. FT23042 TaxID=3393749 RepID=UPI003B5863DF
MADDASAAHRMETRGLTPLNEMNPYLQGLYIARIPLPARVPASFHGTLAPGAQIAA